jgi:4-methyl-5(b-hydroxyethyl)-thiazole monophosphate biosynthesis
MKKACLFLADGCEMVEALTAVDLLRRAGIPVTTVSISQTKEIKSALNVVITADTTIGEFSFAGYDMIILPGGQPGTENLRACRKLTDAILDFAREGKDLAAICAAPTVLAGLGLLKGKKATCYPGCDSGMDGALVTNEAVTATGNIITGRSVGCAIPFALTIVEYYLGKEKADEIRREIVYNMN